MRIAYIAAGAAGMYCGSCLLDNTLAKALIRLGDDVALVPTYTPLRTDDEDVSINRVFYGGINVYLQQLSPLFRFLPRPVSRWLDRPSMLNRLAGRASAVSPAQLGDLAVSVLRGAKGRQRDELEKLTTWLANDFRPDVVHISNALLSGLAPRIRERLNAPIVCNLSGEDIFLDALDERHQSLAYAEIQRNVESIDALIAFSQFYSKKMRSRLDGPREKFRVMPLGLNLDGHGRSAHANRDATVKIGFFARICHEKGLHNLVEACELLAAKPDVPSFTVHAAGYLGEGDHAYLAEVTQRAESGPLAGRFQHHGELDRIGKIAYLQSLDVFSTPTVYQESKGLPAIEALANGAPVVLPDHGSFPEIIAATGGGLLYRSGDSADLAAKLGELIMDRTAAARLGRSGQQAVFRLHSAVERAVELRELYEGLLLAAGEKQRAK